MRCKACPVEPFVTYLFVCLNPVEVVIVSWKDNNSQKKILNHIVIATLVIATLLITICVLSNGVF